MRGLPYPSRVLNSHHPGESLLLLYPLAISPIKPGRAPQSSQGEAASGWGSCQSGTTRHLPPFPMPRRSFSDSSRGDEQLVRQLPALLRQHRPDLMVGEHLYRSPAGFTSWSGNWAKAVAVELALEQSESIADHVGIWGAKVCQWAREIDAEPRFLSPALALAFLQTEQPTLTPDLPRDISCFRLLLPKGTLFSEEGLEIRSVVVAEVLCSVGQGGLWITGERQTALWIT